MISSVLSIDMTEGIDQRKLDALEQLLSTGISIAIPFYETAYEIQELSEHGGDEDYVIFTSDDSLFMIDKHKIIRRGFKGYITAHG